MTGLTVMITLLGIVFLVALCAVGIYAEKKYPQKKFDERQQADRNKGYRFGFWFGVGSQFFGMMAVLHLSGNAVKDTSVLAAVQIAALLIPFMAFTTYCAAKDALLAAWENPAASGIGFLLMALAQFLAAFLDRNPYSNVPKIHCIVLGIGLLYMAAVYFCVLWRQNKE